MNSGNPFGAAIAFFIFMQVVWSLALIGGGLYVLWCLNRIASGVERLAQSREADVSPAAPLAPPFSAQQFTPTTQSSPIQSQLTQISSSPSPQNAPPEVAPPVASPRLPEI